jgi:hypothetical protein
MATHNGRTRRARRAHAAQRATGSARSIGAPAGRPAQRTTQATRASRRIARTTLGAPVGALRACLWTGCPPPDRPLEKCPAAAPPPNKTVGAGRARGVVWPAAASFRLTTPNGGDDAAACFLVSAPARRASLAGGATRGVEMPARIWYIPLESEGSASEREEAEEDN